MAKKISLEEFQQRIKTRFPEEEFTVLEYTALGKPSKIQCNECQQIISVSVAGNFLVPTKAYGCVNCHGFWKKRDIQMNAILEKYDIVNQFVKNTHIHYTIKCKQCGHERTSTLRNLFNHLECGCTTGVLRGRSKEEFINELNQFNNNEYELVSDYINQTTKVLLRHKECGFIWNVRPADIIHGRQGCPKCVKKESKGAKLITNLLKNLNVDFDKEHRLEDTLQRFDFYLENATYKIAIEYNGAQHYEETQFFPITLEQQQERDARKRKWCKEHNIELIEIPYWKTDEEITAIINDIINKFNDYPAREQS